MKITFVNLAWHFGLGNYRFLAKRFIPQIPLALCYLAAVLRKDGHQVSVIDAAIEDLSLGEVVSRVKKSGPRIVGIGSTTFIHKSAEELARALKREVPGTIIISGGYHVSAEKENVLKGCPDFDAAIYGEGEAALRETVRRIEEGRSLFGVRGSIFRESGRVCRNDPALAAEPLDELPFPARELLDHTKYFRYKQNKKSLVTGFIISRGCPFGCIFCGGHHVHGHRVRCRSAKNIADELQDCVERFGIREFMSYDDNFTLNRALAMELCDEILSRKLEISMMASTRVDCVDYELLSKLRQAGLREIGFGIESGNEDILKRLNKDITLPQVREALRMAKSAGLTTYATAMIGNPFETKETVSDTLRFLASLRDLDVTMLSIATPLPGTRLQEMAEKGEGGVRFASGDKGAFNRYGGSCIEVNDLTAEDLVRLQRKGLLRFYLNPRRVFAQYKLLGWKDSFGLIRPFFKTFFS